MHCLLRKESKIELLSGNTAEVEMHFLFVIPKEEISGYQRDGNKEGVKFSVLSLYSTFVCQGPDSWVW